jgi:cyclophilin family peptidyl-prolyl cis-trans isomerase/HEAT repeat protein
MVFKHLSYSLFFFFFILSCSNFDADKFDNQTIDDNSFKDKGMQEIYELHASRKTAEILPFLDHKSPAYRQAAALAFASVQDSAALEKLFILLESDKSLKVRMAAAFAIGQTKDSLAEDRLILLAGKEPNTLVLDKIFEAIGKCGTTKGHEFLTGHLSGHQFNNGVLLGLSRYSIRGIATDKTIEKIVQILSNAERSNETKFLATIYLIRVQGFSTDKYVPALINSFENSSDIFTKINIVASLAKSNTSESFEFLNQLIAGKSDYRIKVNAIKALSNFQYATVHKPIANMLNDSNSNIAVQASEYFLHKGIRQDAEWYLNLAKNTSNWRARANLLSTAIRLSKQKSAASKFVKESYLISTNVYEKANLLKALGSDMNNFFFVRDETSRAKDFPISTAGTEALIEMRRIEDYLSQKLLFKNTMKKDLDQEFANAFKEAILSGDHARVALAAGIIRDEKLNFRELYQNSYFLKQALGNCKLPQELETYRELEKTISFIDGTENKEEQIVPEIKIDWEFIVGLQPKPIVIISTTKGNIHVELFVNEAPVSCANFLKLASQGFYSNKFVHRVVPNFVIQDGCPRGDGWGGPGYTICSEFAMNYYTEGSLGMASAGKDTESSQWFITHSPTPHLDGRYTNFGKVVNGMDVVHQIEVGDKILSVEIKK